MKRRDWLILFFVLLFSLALFLLRPQTAAPEMRTYLRITAPGQSYLLVALDTAQEIVIDQENGAHNVISVFPGGFVMAESNCKNQDCIHQGQVTVDNMGSRPLANQIICLPNKVVLELVSADERVLELGS